MWKKRLIKISVVIVIAIAGYLYFVSHFHYSEGSRTGYLYKFIKKGYVFKTYEGDIYLGGATADNSSLINNLWAFSVPENKNSVVDSLEKYEGTIVRISYYKVITNMPWQGDTPYFAYKAEFVREK